MPVEKKEKYPTLHFLALTHAFYFSYPSDSDTVVTTLARKEKKLGHRAGLCGFSIEQASHI